MVAFYDINGLLVEAIFAGDTSSDLRMSSFDVVVHRFPEVMEHTSLERKDWISTDELRDRLCDICDFLGMHEDILTVARTEAEFPYKWDDLVWDPDDTHLIDGLPTEVRDELIRICLILFDYFFDSCWLNTFVSDEILKGFLRDISAEEVETRKEDCIRRIVDDE